MQETTGPTPRRLTDAELTSLAIEHSSYTFTPPIGHGPSGQYCRSCGHYPRRPVIRTPYPCPVAQALGHIYALQGMIPAAPYATPRCATCGAAIIGGAHEGQDGRTRCAVCHAEAHGIVLRLDPATGEPLDS
jgi:hypothetical protein